MLVNGYVAKKEIANIKIFKTTEKEFANREAIKKDDCQGACTSGFDKRSQWKINSLTKKNLGKHKL